MRLSYIGSAITGLCNLQKRHQGVPGYSLTNLNFNYEGFKAVLSTRQKTDDVFESFNGESLMDLVTRFTAEYYLHQLRRYYELHGFVVQLTRISRKLYRFKIQKPLAHFSKDFL